MHIIYGLGLHFRSRLLIRYHVKTTRVMSATGMQAHLYHISEHGHDGAIGLG